MLFEALLLPLLLPAGVFAPTLVAQMIISTCAPSDSFDFGKLTRYVRPPLRSLDLFTLCFPRARTEEKLSAKDSLHD